MPEPTITSPVKDDRYDFLGYADQIHRAAGYDFPTIFDHYFTHGWVSKGPEHLLIGGHDYIRDDAWLCWWAEVHPAGNREAMLKLLLKCIPYYKPWVAWARPHKGRIHVKYYSTDRLFKFTQGACNP